MFLESRVLSRLSRHATEAASPRATTRAPGLMGCKTDHARASRRALLRIPQASCREISGMNAKTVLTGSPQLIP